MAKNTNISWCDHTFNPWWGCQKVSPACANCYAETWANRYRKDEKLWQGNRVKTKGPWKDLPKWNKEAGKEGIRRRVFVASMADIFENHPALPKWRNEAFDLMEECKNLDFLILTKRPRNAYDYFDARYGHWNGSGISVDIPENFWVGTTVENQQTAAERIPYLLYIPAKIKFLSCEPLLEPIDLYQDGAFYTMSGTQSNGCDADVDCSNIDWVIAGGESGKGCRPMKEEWVLNLKKQCLETGTKFFFKQGSQNNWPDFKNFDSFPSVLQVREFPK